MALTDLILGSPMALSMTGLPQLVIAGVAGGVAVTVAASVYTYKKIEGKWIEKFRADIESINKLHQKYLSKINVPGHGVIQGFPPPFKLSDDKSSMQVDSMHYTDEQMEAVAKGMPYCVDVSLSSYRENVLSAILKLKDYYFSRSNHDDTTAGVICYLVNMLETKCLHFSGYQYDIAYLDAITDFINAYASLEGRTNSQHFSRLEPVYSYLQQAQHDLERHRESLTLEELIKELRDTCANQSKAFLRIFLKMVSPQEQWPLIDNVAIDEIANGILRRNYTSKQVLGLVLKKDAEVAITDSVFKDWIVQLAKYYIHALSPIDGLIAKKIPVPDELFAFVTYAKGFDMAELQKYKKTPEAERFADKLNQIRSVFYYSQNFMTTKLQGHFNTFKFVNIHTNAEIIDRLGIMSQFTRLTHTIISLQYLCTHLLKSIKQLGDIYVKDPNHFHDIFMVLSNLCSIIKKTIGACVGVVMEIQEKNLNTMRLEKQELFPEEVKEALETTREMIAKLGNQVKEYRDELSETSKETQEQVIYDMVSVSKILEKIYPITVTAKPRLNTDKEVVAETVKPSVKEQSVQEHLDDVIPLLKALKPEAPITQKYQQVWDGLKDVLDKSKTLGEEALVITERSTKAQKVNELTERLVIQFKGFMALSETERKENMEGLVKSVHEELAKPDLKEVVDTHSNSVTAYFYEHLCHLGLFSTQTRKKLQALESAYDQLQAIAKIQ